MSTAEEFDEFYVSTRRRLVLQTFALTGDLGASRGAVRDAYVAARHHWSKVGRLADPESWVRPRAWAIAQRRHTARPWHREKSVAPDQAELLEALHKLPDIQRRTLVLTHLVAVPLADIGREIGETQVRAEHHLQAATAAIALVLDCDSTAIRARLESLGPVADTVKLPRPQIIRRNGLRRRRNTAVVGSVLAVLVTIGAGALVVPHRGAPATPRPGALVAKRMLLTSEQIASLAPGQAWQETGTSDNTQGTTGINTMCQASRFADPNGLGTWVRKFVSTGSKLSGLVQTVEISNSPGAAKRAYATTVGWYAGCTAARMQLLDAYDVQGVGEEALVLRMRIPDTQPRSFVVSIARTGALTTSTVLETHSPMPGPAALVVPSLTASVQNLCSSKVAGSCIGSVQAVPALPPKSGEAPGTLAIADLPAVANVAFPWSGTSPVAATVNVAATTCDKTSFSQAHDPVTRTYLIPQANLPQRFGLTETIGEFATVDAATRFTQGIVDKMKACPRKELGSTVSHSVVQLASFRGSSYALWRLVNQVNQKQDKVPFWMGVARVGRYVAQVNLTPVDQYDVDQPTFTALMVRARDRLFEVSR